ncbi:MAG: pyridoxamine 5'-phosphate oxidase family protein [Oscillospiraceae bacterium]|jgi:nitroimidazol reductase NimA-like FMN-containing flavoprotein (pyridoxamine 5'-phosphate oxidase superfamily)|nr:pyridoxamine 5'-phosphate oxidase family protein [Oscillospiraceae bacterium]
MFKAMRRKDRELPREAANEILNSGKYGVLSVVGEDGYPYGVPLHYVLIDGDAHFHSAAEGGHKTERFANKPKASFTVVETKNGIKARSAIVLGTIESLPDMRVAVLERLVEKFVPKFAWKPAKSGISTAQDAIIAYQLKTEQVTAKFIDRPKKQK